MADPSHLSQIDTKESSPELVQDTQSYTKEEIDIQQERSRIDPMRERQLLWKLDLFIAPVIMVLSLISNLDRSNIGFAATQGLSTDLGLVGGQFNVSICFSLE